MKNKTTALILRIFGIVLSVSIILAGICFIAGCLSIYYSGKDPYSRQAVADTFASICIPVYVCIALTIIGFILEFALPLVEEKKTNARVPHMLRRALLDRKDITAADAELINKIKKEEKKRYTHALIRTILLIAGCGVFLAYALNPVNFHSREINSSMIKAMWVLIPCLAVPFAYSVFTAYYGAKSIDREIELIKQLPASSGERARRSDLGSNIARAVILCVGIAILVYGLISGGTADVLTKAVNICTECIGLG